MKLAEKDAEADKRVPSEHSVSNKPQYVRMADTLTERIRSGYYPVDSLLPTEAELCLEFATSRHTVREALRLLTNARLIARRQGSGSRVLNRVEESSYVHSIDSFTDILQELNEARFVSSHVMEVAAENYSCPFLKLPEGGTWIRVAGVRKDDKTGEQLCHSLMFMDSSLREAIQSVPLGGDVCQIVSETIAPDVQEVQTEITVGPVPEEIATAAALDPSELAVKFLHRCTRVDGKVLVVSANFYPIDRFSYRMNLHRGD